MTIGREIHNAINTDTKVLEYVAEHNNLDNIILGVDIITKTGDNLLEYISEK